MVNAYFAYWIIFFLRMHIDFDFQASINVRAIAQGCSEYNITVVLKQEDCVRALRAAHSRFYLSKTTLAVGIIGPGLIGGTLLDQLRDQVLDLLSNFQQFKYYIIGNFLNNKSTCDSDE